MPANFKGLDVSEEELVHFFHFPPPCESIEIGIFLIRVDDFIFRDSEEEENAFKEQTTLRPRVQAVQKPQSLTQPETISLRSLEEGPHKSLHDIDGLIKGDTVQLKFILQ